ncbi:hypothetical protein ACP3W9_00130 [Vibrio anguillarum]
MNNVKSKPKTLLSISEHEEEVWIQQLQDPRSIEWTVDAYTIDINSKNEQLIQAVKKLVLNDIQLNLRYRFSDEFELEKWHSVDSEGLTNVAQVEGEKLSDRVAAYKTTPLGARFPTAIWGGHFTRRERKILTNLNTSYIRLTP